MNLVEVTRSELVESIHSGSISVVDSKGQQLAHIGNPEQVAFMRSSEKPLQALPVVESGAADSFHFSESEIAVICGSHSGELFHVDSVKSILDKIGISEGALVCSARYPLHRQSSNKLISEGKKPHPIHNPCSGKHAGMLALSIILGYSTEGYHSIDHPIQQLILETISDMTEVEKNEIKIGIDGCGVPVHGISLKSMALSFAKLTNPKDLPAKRGLAAKRIVNAMKNNPEMVAGSGRLCTELMQSTDKIVTKVGAEGIYCVGIPEKNIGIAIKIDDGGTRAISSIVIEVLNQLEILDESELNSINSLHYPPIKTHQKEVIGKIRPVFKLKTS